jgi:hypothetical protein
MEPAQILDQLAVEGPLPVEALRAAQRDRAAMTPLLLQAIERYLANGAAAGEENLLFFAFHLLGEWRETLAYRPLARMLKSPPEQLGDLLSGARTETSHRVMAAVFDGDPGPLYELILDPNAEEFIRSRMCEALAMLVRLGRLPREEVEGFLFGCYDVFEREDASFVWNGWQSAITMLGLEELRPVVERAFREGHIPASLMSYKHFEGDLRRALDDPNAPWAEDGDYTLFGDTVEELSDWHGFSAAYWEKQKQYDTRSASPTETKLPSHGPLQPVTNPFKGVGRNDPCPCGSGKKYKKCCLP